MAKDLRTTGDEHYQAKEYKKAVECYTQAIEAETDLGETASSLSSRSAAYIHLGNLDKGESNDEMSDRVKPLLTSPLESCSSRGCQTLYRTKTGLVDLSRSSR